MKKEKQASRDEKEAFLFPIMKPSQNYSFLHVQKSLYVLAKFSV